MSLLFKKSTLLIFFFLLVIFFLSCKKNIENKVDGVWKVTNITNPSSNEYENWHIEKGYFYVEKIKSDGSIIQLSEGEYKIKEKIYNMQRIFSVTKSTNNDLVYEWRITKLTKEYLELHRSDGALFLEFTKQ